MAGRLRQGWWRRVYLRLTTSSRDRRNRLDDVGGHLQAARRERDAVQRLNDAFHAAGKGTRRGATLEGITLQGKDEGLAWAYLLLPALFVVGLIAFISQCRRSERVAQQLAAEEAWQRHLQEAAAKAATAQAALRTTQAQREEVRAALVISAEEDALGAKLESNLEFIKEHLHSKLPSPPAEAKRSHSMSPARH